jgi:hypothetical protein
MVRVHHAVLMVVGLAVAVYGVASLTGGSLGTPPWWERVEDRSRWIGPEEWIREGRGFFFSSGNGLTFVTDTVTIGRAGREWVSAAVVIAGLALVAVGARMPRLR